MEDSNLDHLVKQLYSALIQPAGFIDFLLDFNRTLSMCLSSIEVFSKKNSSDDICWRVKESVPSTNLIINSPTKRRELISSLSKIPIGESVKDQCLANEKVTTKDNGLVTTIVLINDNEWVCRLFFLHNEVEEGFLFNKLLLRQLLPHLKHSLELFLIQKKHNKTSLLQDSFLQQMFIPIVLLDSRGGIHCCNHHAQLILDKYKTLKELDKKTGISNKKTSHQLAKVIKECSTEGEIHILPLKMEDNTELTLAFIPFIQKNLNTNTGIAVFIYSENKIVVDRDILCKLYNLTIKESLVCDGLISGKSLTEIANNTYLSYQTVRTYIKRIMAKTSTHRQTELIVKILRSPACHLIDTANK